MKHTFGTFRLMVITTILKFIHNLVPTSCGLCGRGQLTVQAPGIWRENSVDFRPSYNNGDNSMGCQGQKLLQSQNPRQGTGLMLGIYILLTTMTGWVHGLQSQFIIQNCKVNSDLESNNKQMTAFDYILIAIQ